MNKRKKKRDNIDFLEIGVDHSDIGDTLTDPDIFARSFSEEKRKLQQFTAVVYGYSYGEAINKIQSVEELKMYYHLVNYNYIRTNSISVEDFNNREKMLSLFHMLGNEKMAGIIELNVATSGIKSRIIDYLNNYLNESEFNIINDGLPNIKKLIELISNIPEEKIDKLFSSEGGGMLLGIIRDDRKTMELVKQDGFIKNIESELLKDELNPYTLIMLTNPYFLSSPYLGDLIGNINKLISINHPGLTEKVKKYLLTLAHALDLSEFENAKNPLNAANRIVNNVQYFKCGTYGFNDEEKEYLTKYVARYIYNQLNILRSLPKEVSLLQLYNKKYVVSSFMLHEDDGCSMRILNVNGRCHTDNTFRVVDGRIISYSNNGDIPKKIYDVKFSLIGEGLIYQLDKNILEQYSDAECTIIVKFGDNYIHLPGLFGVQRYARNNNILLTLADDTNIVVDENNEIISCNQDSVIMNSVVNSYTSCRSLKYKKF